MTRASLALTALVGGPVAFTIVGTTAAHAFTQCGEYGSATGNDCRFPQPKSWELGEAVGYCGLTNTAYVRSLQFILYAGGDLAAGDIDGLFGPTTNTALKSWQTHQHLTADGCAGANTWRQAQHGSDEIRGVDNVIDTVPHFVYLGQVPGPWSYTVGKWRYQQPKYRDKVYYYWYDSLATWYFFNGYVEGNNAGYCVHAGTETCVVW